MSNNEVLRRAIRYALFANLAGGAALSPALAQDTDSDQAVALQEVVVTGSRIVQPGLESISPVTVVNAQEIKLQGTTRIEDMLNNLPQVYADFGSNLSNGATGAATVNLRNLGAQRTLVLINGRRLMPGDPTQNGNATPDLNQIPAALVKRVDVLTGGASAVYGADAVAGVVNFIMEDNFEGIRIDANGSWYNHRNNNAYYRSLNSAAGFPLPDSSVNDGVGKDVTFILGGNFADGRGNVTAYAGYRKINAVPESTRDFSACNFSGDVTFVCGGSSTSATGAFFTSAGKLTVGPNNDFIPFNDGPGLYNYAPTTYYQRDDERYTGGLFGHFDVNKHATAYTELSFMHDRTNAQVAPSGAFLGSGTGVDANGIPDGTWMVNCDNPLLSAQQKGIICNGLGPTDNAHLIMGRRNIEGGPRNDDLQHTSFRIVVGAKGEITDGWTYDVYGMVGKTLFEDLYTNDVSKNRLTDALQAVTDPVTGQIVCKANANGAAGAPGCIPYNIWSQGGVTPDQVSYFSVPSFQTGSTDERVLSGSISADLTKYGVKLPTAESGLALAFGAEYRQERMNLEPDIERISNDLAGQGNPTFPLTASLKVKEGFVEARLPLVQDRPFVHELSFETGYRYSDYDLGFSTNTYKFGVDWAPTEDVRLRASFQRAVRAPNLQELFLARFVGLDGSTDPCATSSGYAPTATPEQCARTGVTAAQYGNIIGNPAGQYNGEFAGNPHLKPEESDTKTFGIVLTPRAIPSLAVTLDYFDIKVNDIISVYGYDYTLTQCLAGIGVNTFCPRIHRAPGTGSLWLSPSGYIEDGNLNLGFLHTKGVDLTSSYQLDMGSGGKLSFNLMGTYVDEYVSEPVPGFGSYDCVGLFGNTCGTPMPKWRHRLRTTWQTPIQGFDVSLQWRHLQKTKLDTTSSNPLLAGYVPEVDKETGQRDYLDLSLSYATGSHVTARLGINNLFDKNPPIVAGGNFGSVYVNGNTYPQVYDTLGRYVFINVTADF